MVDLTNDDQKVISAIVTDLRWQKQSTRELAEANAKLVAVMAEWKQTEARLRQAHKMEQEQLREKVVRLEEEEPHGVILRSSRFAVERDRQ